jgi:hypothetical protein
MVILLSVIGKSSELLSQNLTLRITAHQILFSESRRNLFISGISSDTACLTQFC